MRILFSAWMCLDSYLYLRTGVIWLLAGSWKPLFDIFLILSIYRLIRLFIMRSHCLEFTYRTSFIATMLISSIIILLSGFGYLSGVYWCLISRISKNSQVLNSRLLSSGANMFTLPIMLLNCTESVLSNSARESSAITIHYLNYYMRSYLHDLHSIRHYWRP